MLTSTRRGISYPNPDRSDRPDVAVHIGNLIPALETDVVFQQGTDAARIAATHYTNGGLFWYATDTGILWYDTGTAWVNISSGASVPIGGAIEWDYAAAGVPTWSMLQYGQAISRSTYAALNTLATAAGYPHGSGDGGTTFNLADKRGRVSAGKDDMGGTAANRITAAISGVAGTTLGAVCGSEGVTLTTGQMPSHNHAVSGTPTLTDPTHVHHFPAAANAGGAWNNLYSGDNGHGNADSTAQATNITITAGSLATALVGSGTAHLNTQPTIVVNKIIRVI